MESFLQLWLYLLPTAFAIGLLLEVRVPGRVPVGLLVAGVVLFVMGAGSYDDDADPGWFLYVGVFGGLGVLILAALCGGLAISSAWRRRRSREG